jgi:PAS domain S-box-containing protein
MEEILDRELRLLILEDLPTDAELTERELRKAGIRFTSVRVMTREGFIGALEGDCFDLILADYNLPSFDGVAALGLVREKCPYVPFIIVSGRIGEETAIEALKAGAIDYVLKDNLVRLVPSIRRALRESADQRRLRESEKKFRSIFEESKDVIVIMDAEGRLLDINPAGSELFGYEKEELLALDVGRDLYCDAAARASFLLTLYGAGSVREYDVRMKRRDGETLHVLKSASVIRNEQGEIVGYQGVIHDLTERKRLEQQLLQSQKMESIGLLAGGVAHDFNNLLTAILGYGHMIQERHASGNESLRTFIGQVISAANRATELTRNLLTFSRKQIIDPKPILVNEMIIDVTKLLTRIIGEDIELSTSLVSRHLTVMADSGQIGQVLINLATNARDAMPGGGRLHITTRLAELSDEAARPLDLDNGGGYALIAVADTGTGIEEQTRQRIFEPFFTTKETGKGTGLGLAITYGIVKQHSGTITVESEPGRGTTFYIYLPLTEAPAGEEETPEEAPPPCGTETLLVAEDDAAVRAYTKTVLEMAGYKVITAQNGDDAVALFRESRHTIALVLCDVVMPKKNGREVYEEIRRLSPRARFIFTSGYNDEIIHRKGVLEEELDFIMKPASRRSLLTMIREVLDRQG